MKKTLKLMAMVVLVAVTTLMFSSCSKESMIVGKWKCVQEVYNDNGNEIGNDSRINQVWEFKSDGVVEIDGTKVAYSISGDDITIMGGMLNGTITTLTSSKLVLDLQIEMRYGNNPYPTEHLEFEKI